MNLKRVRITPELNLGVLATDTAITGGLTPTGAHMYRAISIIAVWNVQNMIAQEGPVTVGYAHGDYSVTDIKECLEAQGAIQFDDKDDQEQANRLVRVVGTLDRENSVLNNGRPVKTRLNWLIGPGHNINMFAFNESTSNVETGSSIKLTGDMWIKLAL